MFTIPYETVLYGGLALMAVPIVIHLINLLRHRRVEWAAMEFLLASQRKNSTWIRLKELLLLLMRMAAVALVGLVLAQPYLESQWGRLFGGTKTHHFVLLDDSFSMSDRGGDTSAMDRAKAVIERIGTRAVRETQPQTFTLLRFSQAGRLTLGTQPDMLEESVDTEFVGRLRDTLDGFDASQTAAGPLPAVEAVAQLLGEGDGDRRIVYVISDFRARQWDEPGDLKQRLAQLNESGAQLHLINCVQAQRPNLALSGLAPGPGTRAAGVPLFMEVRVTNYSDSPVKNVPVLLETDGNPAPAVKIEQIPGGETVTERFPVHFSTAGEHRIVARLESDVVAADNFRYCVVDFPPDVPVLLVDGDPDATDARYLSAALSPGGPVTTGVNPRIEGPRYLSVHPLEAFRAIYVANVDRLDESAVEALESYASAGGGVGFFVGPRTSARFLDEQLYREGRGLFPAPVSGQAELLVDRLLKAPDVEVTDHSIFQVFAGRRNSFLAAITVSRYFEVPESWEPEADSGVRVIAKLRNGAPLAVERTFGEGRVVAFLTTAAPTWNNWARGNPSFVVAMLELQAFLSGDPVEEVTHLVGTPLELDLDPAAYDPTIHFVPPDLTEATPSVVQAVPTAEGTLSAVLTGAETSGVYEVRLARKDGGDELRRYPFNVEASEGDLAALSGEDLAPRLEGVDYDYVDAGVFEYAEADLAGSNLSDPLLLALVVLLVLEQLLATAASYHPSSKHALGEKGGAR